MRVTMSVAAAEETLAWLAGLDEEQLERWYGPATFWRGVGYADEGAVTKLLVDGRTVLARVLGSRAGQSYHTLVLAPAAGQRGRPESSCSCPVGRDCKHVVAAIITAMDR